MSCTDINPCGCLEQNCNDCSPYDNCGCLNPTTFECITKPPVLANVIIDSGMNGAEVLKSIDDVLGSLKESIAAIVNPTENSSDVRVKISATDTSTGFLEAKLQKGNHITVTKMGTGTNESLRISVTPKTLISPAAGNLLSENNGLLFISADGVASPVYLRNGNGISITGTNTASDPFIISANGFIQATRSCFDGIWKDFINSTISVPGVSFVSSNAKYRIRYDGTVEFKGNATYTVNFSEYHGTTSKYSFVAGGIGSSCLTLPEQNGVYQLKGLSFIDTPQPASDQITQSYGYIIRKSSKDIYIDFQSAFSGATTKTIVVSFDGALCHPSL
jgi:hypothetical protein